MKPWPARFQSATDSGPLTTGCAACKGVAHQTLQHTTAIAEHAAMGRLANDGRRRDNMAAGS
jgi:hypothetical protein